VRASNKSPKPHSVQVDILDKDIISYYMHQFIEKVVNVVNDSHFGFRAVADQHDMHIDDLHIICLELLRELTNDHDN